MKNIPSTVFEELSLLLLFAILIYFSINSLRRKVAFPWGMLIVIIGLLFSGVVYYVSYEKVIIFPISLSLIIGLIGILWDVNSIRQQFYWIGAKEFLRFAGIGFVSGSVLAVLFIGTKAGKSIPIDHGYTWAAILGVAIQGGIAEEILFRGFLLSNFKKYECNSVISIVTQTLIFTFLHYSLYSNNLLALLVISINGATAGFITWKSNNLVSAMTLHIVFNLLSVSWWLII